MQNIARTTCQWKQDDIFSFKETKHFSTKSKAEDKKIRKPNSILTIFGEAHLFLALL